MATNDSWGRRLRDAKRDYEKRHDTRLSYAEIGVRVAAVVGRDRPFASTSVRSWFVEGQEPEAFAITAALAVVLEADAGALAFGRGVEPASASAGRAALVPAELPGLEPQIVRPLTEEEKRASVARRAARKKPHGRAG